MSIWVKGISGAGRKPITEALIKVLDESCLADDPDDESKMARLARTLVSQAISGNLDATKVVLERIEGKVVDKVSHTDPSGQYEQGMLTDAQRATRIMEILTRSGLSGAGQIIDVQSGPSIPSNGANGHNTGPVAAGITGFSGQAGNS